MAEINDVIREMDAIDKHSTKDAVLQAVELYNSGVIEGSLSDYLEAVIDDLPIERTLKHVTANSIRFHAAQEERQYWRKEILKLSEQMAFLNPKSAALDEVYRMLIGLIRSMK